MIWSATLTVATDVNGAGTYGCHRFASGSGECATALTSTAFTHAGNAHKVGEVIIRADSAFAFALDQAQQLSAQQMKDFENLVVRVDGLDLRIADSFDDSNGWGWRNVGSPGGALHTAFTTKSQIVVQLLEPIDEAVGLSVTRWQGELQSRDLGDGTFGCRNGVAGAGCGDGSVFSGGRFNHPGGGSVISYSVQELSFEQLAVYARETEYQVVFTVESDWTVDLKPMTLVLSVGASEHRLAFNSAKRSNHGRTFTWRESIEPLTHDWGDDKTTYDRVKVSIHAVRTGLATVRVHYGGLRNGKLFDADTRLRDAEGNVLERTTQTGSNFARWDVARAKPYDNAAGRAYIAVIPGEFPSIDESVGKVTTTHVRLFMSGSWPDSTVLYGVGTWNTPPPSLIVPRPSDGGSEFIPLNAASKNTYVWVRVQNGDQIDTHLVIIDPPPRTFKVNPEIQVTEGDEATVTVSLGSPATSGGVTLDVTAAYGDGGTTADDVGEIVSTVTVPEGQTSARIAVPTVEDYFVEDDESFTVSVSHVGQPVWAKDPEGADTTVVTIVDDDAPVALPPGPEPHNIAVTPGDGTLTVTWDVSARDGHDDSEIWHVLRWFQPYGGAHRWDNPRDPRAVGKNDGLSVDPGVNSYTIEGLTNGTAADVFVRSMVGHRNNMSERDANSSRWVRLNGVHTTPVAASVGAPTVAAPFTDFGNLTPGTRRDVPLTDAFTDPDGDTLTIAAASSDADVATVTVQHDPDTGAATAIAVTAVSSGAATITITAQDPAGNQAADTFTVTVPTTQQQQQQQGDSDDGPPPPPPTNTAPTNDAPGNDGPANDGPSNDGPTNNDRPNNDRPANDGPTNDTPTNDGPGNDGPTNNDRPANDRPANDGPSNDAPSNDRPSNSGTPSSGPTTSGTPSSGTQSSSAPQDPDGTQDADDTQDNDEVTLERVQTAVEQYNNGELGYEELLDLIRRYLTN